jgi:hypothetical protein
MALGSVTAITGGSNVYRDDVYFSPKIALYDYSAENQGRGLIATQNILVFTHTILGVSLTG